MLVYVRACVYYTKLDRHAVPIRTKKPAITRPWAVYVYVWRLRAAYWCERPELFAAIADGRTEEDRALAVLRWFIVSCSSFLFINPRVLLPNRKWGKWGISCLRLADYYVVVLLVF